MDYILAKHGNGRFVVGPAAPNFADYLYWYHFANGTFMPRLVNAMMVGFAAGSNDHPMAQSTKARETAAFEMIERRLGEVPYLAGSEFTAADIMNFFPLTTLRTFRSEAPAARPNTRAYVKRVSERPAYRRAMAAGDPGLPLTFG
jgi:glutathione S-transferase